MKTLLFVLLLIFVLMPTATAQDAPEFRVWIECVGRGPFPGRADAQIAYSYAGQFSIMAEDSRYFGDLGAVSEMVFPFAVEPGEHRRFDVVHVGALKAVLWKVVLFDELHVLAIWDDPTIPDCPFVDEATPTPEPSA